LVIRRAANNLAFRSATIVYFANCEPIRVRVTRGRGDLRNDNIVDVRAARLDFFGFDAGASEQIGNVFRIFWKIDKFAQPVNGKFHFYTQSSRAESRGSRGLA